MVFDLFKTYNFDTISVTVLKQSYKGLSVIGFGGFRQAIKYGGTSLDITTIRQQLMAETGLPLIEASVAKYIFFEDIYKNELVLAEDWINISSVSEVSTINLDFRVRNATSDDAAIIMNAIRAMGYADIELLQ